ncbi:helix-turn-helix domain-containing protein [Zooshikella harenae]|uniref:Helix-turn-helix transcriptional regulator n=1 Tax=Zooshikella harenae TaxID=2827238 RepID=A0ABS5ZCJ2_9GAMM|nr:helix-turn-helix transcriptional regulator [Zooshikella harenae]MBU2711784.1 helix-turn-helix transcriptional regulator [Zooshikella harenae]
MSEITQLIKSLKHQLRAHGITYAQVATRLDISEASVKRLFATEQFSLQRLHTICSMMNISIAQLVQQSQQEKFPSALTIHQEKALTADNKLLLIAILVLNHWQFPEIIAYYELAETELIQLLAQLDRLKIIDLLPNNRIKLRVDSNFHWLEDGPIQQFFQQHVPSSFFRSRFRGKDELLLCVNGMLSSESIGILQKQLRELGRKFNELHYDDTRLSLEERHGTCMVLAIRPWSLPMFEELKRSNT